MCKISLFWRADVGAKHKNIIPVIIAVIKIVKTAIEKDISKFCFQINGIDAPIIPPKIKNKARLRAKRVRSSV